MFEWLNQNKLKLNVKKTKCMIINSRRRLSDVQVFINGDEIERVDCMKYLGVMIDSKLTLNENAIYACKKLAKKIGLFGRIAKNLTFVARMNVYNRSIISPHFDFCSSLLMSSNQQCRAKLQRLQNRAIRVILRCSKYTSTALMYEALNIMNVKPRLFFNTLKMVYKIKHGLVWIGIHL